MLEILLIWTEVCLLCLLITARCLVCLLYCFPRWQGIQFKSDVLELLFGGLIMKILPVVVMWPVKAIYMWFMIVFHASVSAAWRRDTDDKIIVSLWREFSYSLMLSYSKQWFISEQMPVLENIQTNFGRREVSLSSLKMSLNKMKNKFVVVL